MVNMQGVPAKKKQKFGHINGFAIKGKRGKQGV